MGLSSLVPTCSRQVAIYARLEVENADLIYLTCYVPAKRMLDLVELI